MRQQIETLRQECQKRHIALEEKYSMVHITRIVEMLPIGCLENTIKHYQGIIRGNSWYFPILQDVSVTDFLNRWGAVHASYLKVAEKVFGHLSENCSLDSLVDANLLEDVIRSETMRGWVGKRSPSGLDALLNSRVEQLEELLQNHFDIDTVDELLSVGGIFEDASFASAETEMVRLFQQYKHQHGVTLLTPEILATFANKDVPVTLLREFCRCSISEFNKKLSLLQSNNLLAASGEIHTLERLVYSLEEIPEVDRNRATMLFEEVRVLNYLNLNLEVKYSFKGWAGLMHEVVFAACGNATNIPNDVYAMHTKLKKGDKS